MRVRFTDLDGKVHEEDAEGLYATCIQHEIDHLNGVLFVDYLSKLKRDRVLKKFCKSRQARGGVADAAFPSVVMPCSTRIHAFLFLNSG